MGKSKAAAAQPREKTYRQSFGAGLYLLVRPGGTKSWEFRRRDGEKIIATRIGGFPELTAEDAKRERDKLRVEARKPVSSKLTIAATATEWQESEGTHWSTAHAAQVVQCFNDHINPLIGDVKLVDVTPDHVLQVVDTLLRDGKVETARRARQRLDAMLEWTQLRRGLPSNPAAATRRAFKTKAKQARRQHPKTHFAAVPLEDVPQLVRALRGYTGGLVASSFVWFVARTACRTGEARFATWDEFDLDRGIWLLPPSRMKAGREHMVPLAPPVVKLLRDLYPITGKRTYVFTHPTKHDKPVSENLILYVVKAIGFDGRMTGHGWRTLFSTWANESKKYRPDVIERCLAHGEDNRVRDAYNKAKYWPERVEIMLDWSEYLSTCEQVGKSLGSAQPVVATPVAV